jgi:hypothetical protein
MEICISPPGIISTEKGNTLQRLRLAAKAFGVWISLGGDRRRCKAVHLQTYCANVDAPIYPAGQRLFIKELKTAQLQIRDILCTTKYCQVRQTVGVTEQWTQEISLISDRLKNL